MSNIILCDIDGTVANNEHRQHYLKNQKDWKSFFDEMVNDIPIHDVINKIIEEKKIVNFFDCKRYFWKEIDTYKDLCDMKTVINKKKFKYWPL